MRPPSIIQFERLYVAKILIGVAVGIWAFFSVATSLLPADAPAAVRAYVVPMMIASVALQLAIGLALLYFIARRASLVAKWIFVVLTLIGVAGLLRSYLLPIHRVMLPAPLRVAGVVELLIGLSMLLLLFRPDAKAWFGERPRAAAR